MNMEEKLNKLCGCLLNNEELTTKKLLECGFTSTDLTKLIKNDTLERVKRGLYKLKDIKVLYDYRTIYIEEENFEQVIAILKKCTELDPHFLLAYFQLFYQMIYQKN